MYMRFGSSQHSVSGASVQFRCASFVLGPAHARQPLRPPATLHPRLTVANDAKEQTPESFLGSTRLHNCLTHTTPVRVE